LTQRLQCGVRTGRTENVLSADATWRNSFHLQTFERSAQMFTRVVEITSKAGKSPELADLINEKGVPILKKQRGFVDEIVLISHTEPDRVLALSFWKKREDAEQYQREKYQKIHDALRHLIEAEPVIRTFDVHTSIGHKIATQKAA
jgi:heme-degrading monooxygenase HmoA